MISVTIINIAIVTWFRCSSDADQYNPFYFLRYSSICTTKWDLKFAALSLSLFVSRLLCQSQDTMNSEGLPTNLEIKYFG